MCPKHPPNPLIPLAIRFANNLHPQSHHSHPPNLPNSQLVDRWARPANIQDFFAAFEQSYIKMTALNVASSGEAG